MVDDVVAMTGRGLITLERARLVDGDVPPSGDDAEAVKMTLYVGRQQRVGGVPAHVAACDLFHRLGFAGAISLSRRRRHASGASAGAPGSSAATSTSHDDRRGRHRRAGVVGRRRTGRAAARTAC